MKDATLEVLKCLDSSSQCLVECPNLSGEDPKHVDPEFASPLRNGRKKKKKLSVNIWYAGLASHTTLDLFFFIIFLFYFIIGYNTY